ncbi:hypothetical protein SAMN05444280_105108 [Tangfeifania diversioriginum]|uniref:Uncharacterized protein n=1 Tax=Tangfeifania diversioriginum TaxID=1168035 RepID=A0A1M6DM93_9BACT|nr:hypothetical protein [Tangfeifania diversioriginum]SHI74251.1 hypothetical protein SAMN05444280_105108 [Tangfeifania diversioriginum]
MDIQSDKNSIKNKKNPLDAPKMLAIWNQEKLFDNATKEEMKNYWHRKMTVIENALTIGKRETKTYKTLKPSREFHCSRENTNEAEGEHKKKSNKSVEIGRHPNFA